MAGPHHKRRGPRGDASPKVVRRPKEERKGLSKEFEALARGDEKRLRPPKRKSRKLNDPRPVALVPGVANRDARRVYEARIGGLRQRVSDAEGLPDDPSFADALAEAGWMALWRGQSVTSFSALLEDVLGIDPEEGRELARGAAERLDLPAEPLDEHLVAAWMRAEAALLENGSDGSLRPRRREDGEIALELAIPSRSLAEDLAAIGRRIMPLARDRAPEGERSPPPGERGRER